MDPYSTTAIASIDKDEALARFLELTAIPGRSCEESRVADAIIRLLIEAGVPADSITRDDAHQRIPGGGDTGNVFVHLPGDDSKPTTLLSAHMDTVPICLDCDPDFLPDHPEGPRVVATGPTGLGADDRAGCSVVLAALAERMRFASKNRDSRLPPVVAAFLVQEEIGLKGARYLDVNVVGKVDRAFNFDGGTMEAVKLGAIGGERIDITVQGHPAHAGVAPEKGVSAIVIASEAISRLQRDGWLGRVVQPNGSGTANVGVIEGGDATNVVTPRVTLRAEARSHDAGFRTEIVAKMKEAFENAATQVTDEAGRCGAVEWSSVVDYDSFRLPDDHPSVVAAVRYLSAMGYKPKCDVVDGGLDANWLYKHGIEAVTLGCGQAAIHTADEHLLVDHYWDACRFATTTVLGL